MRRDVRDLSIDILLVEDNPGDVRLLQRAFDDVGIPTDLHVVTSGTRAIDYLRKRNVAEAERLPDVLLLDLYLPGLTGWEVLEEITENGSPEVQAVPVIVLTNSQALETMYASLDHEVYAYYSKPYDPDDYKGLVRSILGSLSAGESVSGVEK